MTNDEQAPSILKEIDQADTPLEAVRVVVGRLSLRRAVALPFEVGRDIWKITMNGDLGEMLSSTVNHQQLRLAVCL